MQYMIVVHDWMGDLIREVIGPFSCESSANDYTKRLKARSGDMEGVTLLVSPLTTPHHIQGSEAEKFSPKLRPGVAMIALVHYDDEAIQVLGEQFKGVLDGTPPDFDLLKQHLYCGRFSKRTDDTVTIKGMDGNVTVPLESVLTVIYGI
jgi:hypothetical protein